MSAAGRSSCRVHLRCHPLFDHPLHTKQAYSELVLDQLANGAYSAVAKMVDVIRLSSAVVDVDHALDQLDDVFLGESLRLLRDIDAKAAVQLVAAHLAKVVLAIVEEKALNEGACVLNAWRLTRSQPAVKLEKSLFLVRDSRVASKRRLHELAGRDRCRRL